MQAHFLFCSGPTWIGATDETSENNFVWTDGSAGQKNKLEPQEKHVYCENKSTLCLMATCVIVCIVSFTVGYTNWSPGQPHVYHADNEDCVRQLSDGTWDDQSCPSSLNPWICEAGQFLFCLLSCIRERSIKTAELLPSPHF